MPVAQISSILGAADSGGQVKVEEDGREYIWCYFATATKGQLYTLTYDGDEATNPTGSANATSTVYQYLVVATKTSTTAGFQWAQYKGDCDFALVDGTTDVAKDDFLEVINAGTAMIKDATSRSALSVAIAREAQTANAATATLVYLIGDRVTNAAT